MKKTIIYAASLLILASCSGKTDEQQEQAPKDQMEVTLTDKQLKIAGIKTGKSEERSIASVLKINGKIEVPPQNTVSISAPLGGYLKSTKLLPGMQVRKGEVLAVLEDQQYIQLQQDYLTAKAKFRLSDAEYSRQKTLNATKATSDKVFEQVRAEYEMQNVLVKSLEQKLKLIGLNPNRITADNITRTVSIVSPINGFVSAVNVNIGKYLNPSDVLFELVNPEDIHLSLTVFEKDVNNLFVGQKVVAYTNNNPDKKYTCKVVLISKNLSNDRSAVVHCHFDQYDKNLLPGMYMNAEADVKSNNATALPDEAIVRYENKQYVFVKTGKNRFEMQEVTIGNSEHGYTEIKDLDTHAAYVLKGAYNLLMTLKNTED
jgi:cobalt-zinc-cadmium efflux system membrane fusion protein